MRDQLTVISTKLDFMQWVGSAIGLLLIVSIYSSITDRLRAAGGPSDKEPFRKSDRELLEQLRGLLEKTTKT